MYHIRLRKLEVKAANQRSKKGNELISNFKILFVSDMLFLISLIVNYGTCV